LNNGVQRQLQPGIAANDADDDDPEQNQPGRAGDPDAPPQSTPDVIGRPHRCRGIAGVCRLTTRDIVLGDHCPLAHLKMMPIAVGAGHPVSRRLGY
jgi:hypothetical protein